MPVSLVLTNSVTSGTTDITFSSNEICTNVQIITFLWRANGSSEPEKVNPSYDVKGTDYYYKATLWAIENGIISCKNFESNKPCTRAMTVNYLWQAAKRPVVSGKNQFTDIPDGASYAKCVRWAVQQGITTGATATTFEPNATCTRGQIVTFLYRAYQ